MSVPQQKPGRSKQDYSTPADFIDAVKKRLRIHDFGWDLAADELNTKSSYGYFNEAQNAIVQDWHNLNFMLDSGWCWLNPPFAHIEPWVKKAWEESQKGAYIAMLIPAGVGANWWRDWVHDKAHVLLLNGRLSFDGIAPYPKDCALLLYTPMIHGGYEVWTWRM